MELNNTSHIIPLSIKKFIFKTYLHQLGKSFESQNNRNHSNNKLQWTKGRFSKTCCTYDKMKEAFEEIRMNSDSYCTNSNTYDPYQYFYHLFESGFWNMFELFNHGDLSLICGILSVIEQYVKPKRIDRLVGIAVGGLPLASLTVLGLEDRGIPMSIMSVYPFMQMDPFPRNREKLLVVDTSLQTGFTIRTLADKMGPYLTRIRPKVKKYLVGLTSKTLRSEFPLREPEFYKVWRQLISLAYCDSEDEFNKIKEKPLIEDSWMLDSLANPDTKWQNSYKHLYKKFVINQNSKTDLNTLCEETFKSKKYKSLLFTNLTFPHTNKKLKKCEDYKEIPMIRIAGFYEKPELIIRTCKTLYSILDVAAAIPKRKDSDTEKPGTQSTSLLMVIIGGRKMVPFAVGLSLAEMVNCNRINSEKLPPRIWMTIARRMGTYIPYLNRKKMSETNKILILDTMIKDGLVARKILDVLFSDQFMAKGQNLSSKNSENSGKSKTVSLGIFSLVATKKGTKSIEEHIKMHQEEITQHELKIQPLWDSKEFIKCVYTIH